MGSIFTAHCSCGYESADLFEGCGFAGSCSDLATCEHCRKIVSIRSSSIRKRCPTCRRKVQIIEINTDENGNPKPGLRQCPQCGKSTLELYEVGVWD